MNKKILVLISMLCSLNLFAQETTVAEAENPVAEDSKISFSFDFGMETSFNLAGHDDELAFDSFCFEVTDLNNNLTPDFFVIRSTASDC